MVCPEGLVPIAGSCVCQDQNCCIDNADCNAGQVCSASHRCMGEDGDVDDGVDGDDSDGDDELSEDVENSETDGDGVDGDGTEDDDSEDDDVDGDVDGDVDEFTGSLEQPYYGLEALTSLEKMPYFLPLARTYQYTSSDPYDENDDYGGQNLYLEGSTHIIFDEKRPGCIYRMNFFDPNQINGAAIKFNFDDETSPRINKTIEQMFSGDSEPFLEPLIGSTNISSTTRVSLYSYVPICWKERLKIGSSMPLRGYNITYQTFATDEGIETWSQGQDVSDAVEYLTTYTDGSDPKEYPEEGTSVINGDYSIEAGDPLTLTNIASPEVGGVIQGLEIKIIVSSDLEDVMNNAALEITWDNRSLPDVSVPLGMFFGHGHYDNSGEFPWYSVALGIRDDGWMYSHFPMPFAKSADIKIINYSSTDINSLIYKITWTEGQQNADMGNFCAIYTESTPTASGIDFQVLEAWGRGKYVGTVLAMENDTSYTNEWLYGDERIYLDDMMSPSIRGTGTDAFFNGGGLWVNQPYEHPFFGVWKNNGYPTYQYSARRLQLSDSLPFNHSIKVGFEHGPVNDVNANYRSVAYYYLSCLSGTVWADELILNDFISEDDHEFQKNGFVTHSNVSGTYPGEANAIPSMKQGLGITERPGGAGYFEVTFAIDPTNMGVRLKRTLDYSINRQDAVVYMLAGPDNDQPVYLGNWYTPGRNSQHIWRDSIFDIPAESTHGQDKIVLKIEWADGNEWNMYDRLTAYNFVAVQGDSEGPGQVKNFAYAMYGLQPDLTWDPPVEGTPAHIYHVYRGDTNYFQPEESNKVGMTMDTTFRDPEVLSAETTYYYIVVAEDCTGVKGVPSDVLPVETGLPPFSLEGEDNYDSEQSRPDAGVVKSYIDFGFSQDKVIYWEGNDSGRLVVTGTGVNEIPFDGEYDITVTYLKGPKMGKWQFRIGSNPLGQEYDGYSATEVSSGEVYIGKTSLSAGIHSFVFAIKGKNAASIGYDIGIDIIRLK